MSHILCGIFSENIPSTPPACLIVQRVHVADRAVCHIDASDTNSQDQTSTFYDADVDTCVQPFENSRAVLQTTFRTLTDGFQVFATLLGRTMTCSEPYALVYSEIPRDYAGGNTEVSLKRQCELLSRSHGINTDRSECVFVCYFTEPYVVDARITLVLQAPTWSPVTHKNSYWCETNFTTVQP